MNIWICNPYDPLPGEGLGELRYARLARALIEQGHRVTWWSADWSHALKRRRSRARGGAKVGKCESEKDSYSGCHDQELITGKLETGKLELVLLPVPAYLQNISLRRIWSHRCYAWGISKRADAHATEHGKPDLILFRGFAKGSCHYVCGS